jgi:hypothetical protein
MATMGDGSWVARLGAYPGIEGEEIGLWLEEGEPPRLVHLAWLPAVAGEARTRLVRDAARAAEVLHHPNILAPLAIEEVDGGLALVVEHADGETLREILAVGGRLPPAVAARVVRDACAAVHFAHEEGHEEGPFVHGWIQPANLLVSRAGVTLVGGFGAAAGRSTASLVPWQSPEQVLGGPRAASRQSDVYLLGLVLHACLAGENPFAHEPDPGVAILSRPPPSLEPLGVPPSLAAVARRALSVKALDRFGTADDMARAVDEALPDLASPGAVAAWVESLFPAGMGLRAQRQRAVESAWQAARNGPRPEPPAEEIGEEHILDLAPSPEADLMADELRTGQFQLAAPPFPHSATARAGGADGGGGRRGAPDRRPETPSPAAAPSPPPPAAAVAARTPRPPVAAHPARPAPAGPAPSLPPSHAFASPAPDAPPGRGASAPAPEGPPGAASFSPIPPAEPRRGVGRTVAVAAVAAVGLALGWWLSASPVAEPGPGASAGAEGAGEPRGAGAIPEVLDARPGREGTASPNAGASGLPPAAGATRAASGSPSPAPPATYSPSAPRSAPPPVTRPFAPPARGPSAAPAPAPSPAPGLPVLEVLASEPGELFIDGKRAGRPPLQRPVPSGRREVRLLDANLGLDVTRIVEVRSPRTSIRIDVGKARLTVEAPELAEISLDGRLVARGSVRDLEIWEGRHRIEVSLGEARDRHDFRVGANETYAYEVQAVPR